MVFFFLFVFALCPYFTKEVKDRDNSSIQKEKEQFKLVDEEKRDNLVTEALK